VEKGVVLPAVQLPQERRGWCRSLGTGRIGGHGGRIRKRGERGKRNKRKQKGRRRRGLLARGGTAAAAGQQREGNVGSKSKECEEREM